MYSQHRSGVRTEICILMQRKRPRSYIFRTIVLWKPGSDKAQFCKSSIIPDGVSEAYLYTTMFHGYRDSSSTPEKVPESQDNMYKVKVYHKSTWHL
jgi:hypothetical protein